MNYSRNWSLRSVAVAALLHSGVWLPSSAAAPLGTAFTYQGQLVKDGALVSDTCDFIFGLWNSDVVGNEVIGSPVGPVSVGVEKGLFTVDLDFGNGAIDGDARWLEISVRCSEDAGFLLLSPRVELTPAPHALYCANAGQLDGQDPGDFITGVVATDGLEGGGSSGEVTLAIANGGVSSAKIGTGAVTTTKIGDSQVTSPKLANAVVATDKLANLAVTSAKVAANAIGNSRLAMDLASLGKISGGVIATSGTTVMVIGTDSNPNNSANLQLHGFDNQLMINHTGVGTATHRASIVYNNFDNLPHVEGGLVFQRRSGLGEFQQNLVAIRADRGWMSIAKLIGDLSPQHPIHIGTNGDTSNGNGAHVTVGGVWTNGSDRSSKQNFEEIDRQEILRRVVELPITQWQYKGEPEQIYHIGPVAQDFYAAFGTGSDDRYIGTIDADGVALAAIQGLHEIVSEKNCMMSDLQDQNSELTRRNAELEARLSGIESILAEMLTQEKGARNE
jgi:hypothetical protein